MAFFRIVFLPAIVLATLLGFGQTYNGEELTLPEAIFRFQHAQAQELTPAATSTAELPTPIPSASSTTTSTATLADTQTASTTPTPTEVSEATPAPTDTQAADQTGTSTPTLVDATTTPTPFLTITATPEVEVVETVIGPAGGTIESADGHAFLTFPEGAATEPLRIRVETRDAVGLPAPLPVSQTLNHWDFSAVAIERNNEPVHEFAAPINVDLKYSKEELFGLSTSGIRYWSFDDVAGEWVESLVTPTDAFVWSVSLNHFSTQATGTEGAIDLPTLLDAGVNANTGSATFSLPVSVAPGVGGLAPQLQLTYDSARVDETGNGGTSGSRAAPAGWVGVGWDLSTPHISRAGERFYLNMAGAGSQIILQSDGTPSTWRARDEKFLDIQSSCSKTNLLEGGTCYWTVRDQSGTKYHLGYMAGANAMRHYRSLCFGSCTEYSVYYQWDLAEVADVHGNKATYTYQQVMGAVAQVLPPTNPPWTASYVISSYPSVITYPGGKVEFNLDGSTSTSTTFKHSGSFIQVRADVQNCGALDKSVIETRKLASIVAKSWDGSAYTTANSYTFDVGTSGSSCDSSGAKLNSVAVKGRDGGTLTTVSFDYASKTAHYTHKPSGSCVASSDTAANLRLTSVKNGFGGEVLYDYLDSEALPPSGAACTTSLDATFLGRYHVESITRDAGSAWTGSADIVTEYDYDDGPNYWNSKLSGETNDHWTYRGFGEVTAVDGEDNRTVSYFVKPSESGELSGRQKKIDRWGPGTGTDEDTDLWHRVTFEYTSTPVPSTTNVFANVLFRETVRLRDPDGNGASAAVQSKTEYTYEYTHGAVTQVLSDPNTAGDGDTCRIAKKTYTVRKDSTVYLVLPKLEQVVRCLTPTETPWAETEMFYDGAGASGTVTPVAGNLTAMRRMTDTSLAASNAQKFIYTFFSYYSNGNPKESSVPIYQNATMTPTGGGATGWVPTSKGRALIEYDSGSVPPVATETPVGRFPTKQTVYVYDEDNSANGTLVTEFDYDRVLGVATNVFNPNDMEVETLYDEYGRVLSVWRTLDPISAGTRLPGTVYEYSWGTQSPPTGDNYTRVRYRRSSNFMSAEDRFCMDGLGRERQTIQGNGTTMSLTQKTYNAVGQPSNTQVFEVATNDWCDPGADQNLGPNNYAEYDPMGNPSRMTQSTPGAPSSCNPSCVSVDYRGTETDTVDQLGHMDRAYTDGWGRTVMTRDYTGDDAGSWSVYSTTQFNYDMFDNLISVFPDSSGGSNAYTLISYDALGRKTSMVDPDMSGYSTGTTRIPWTYGYDAAGNLTEQVDARGVTTTLEYDSLGRIRTKSHDVPSVSPVVIERPATTYTYDEYDGSGLCDGIAAETALGRLTVVSDGEVTTKYCYDVRGRQVKKQTKIDVTDDSDGCSAWSRSYTVEMTYDQSDRIKTLKYPDGEIVTYTYHDGATGGGKLKQLASTSPTTTYIKTTGITYHVSGAVASIPLETGTYDQTTYYSYDDRHRLDNIDTTDWTTSSPQDLFYQYFEDGNIEYTYDEVTSEAVEYEYDDLGRLTDMSVNATPVAEYEYDTSGAYGGKIGNMTRKKEGASDLSLTYTGEHIHAVASHGGSSNSYDKNGNSYDIGDDLHWYDADNRLSRINVWTSSLYSTTYLYDASGEVVRRKIDDVLWNPTQRTVFVDGIFEVTVEACETQSTMDGTYTKYYQALGRIIATRSGTITDGVYTNGAVSYMLADHLGSTTTTIAQSNGAVESSGKYWPFGGPRGASTVPNLRYTGQRHEPSDANTLGLYYYHARFYSPVLGHFTSPDPTPGGGLNRFALGFSNPLSYRDLDGYAPTDEDISSCASNLLDCLSFSYAVDYGINDLGIILVGGRGGDASEFSELIEEFLSGFEGCAGVGAQSCYEKVQALLNLGPAGANAAYHIFGVRFIGTDNGDLIHIASSLFDTDATHALGKAVADTSKKIVGVVGFSLGASVVLNFFSKPENENVNLAFFVIEPPEWGDSRFSSDSPEKVRDKGLRQLAGSIEFRLKCCRLSVIPFYHDDHNNAATADNVMSKLRSLTSDLQRGVR